jgi:hypothetical protein
LDTDIESVHLGQLHGGISANGLFAGNGYSQAFERCLRWARVCYFAQRKRYKGSGFVQESLSKAVDEASVGVNISFKLLFNRVQRGSGI